MGQQEIMDFLRKQRSSGNDAFFTIHEISKGIDGSGSCLYHNVRKSLYSLVRSGFVESKAEGDVWEWVRVFRLHKKYVDVGDNKQ